MVLLLNLRSQSVQLLGCHVVDSYVILLIRVSKLVGTEYKHTLYLCVEYYLTNYVFFTTIKSSTSRYWFNVGANSKVILHPAEY